MLKLIILLAIGIGFLVPEVQVQAQPIDLTLPLVSWPDASLRIRSRCGDTLSTSTSTNQTGFVTSLSPRDSDHPPDRIDSLAIVSALHGALCPKGNETWSGILSGGQDHVPLELSHVDIGRDLALFQPIQPEAWLHHHPLSKLPALYPKPYSNESTLDVTGFPRDMMVRSRRHCDVDDPPIIPLGDFGLIPFGVFENRLGPQASTEVLRLLCWIAHGDSGAPVVNAQGQVVAVINGGFANIGLIGHAWAMPFENVIWSAVGDREIETQLVKLRIAGSSSPWGQYSELD